MSLPKATREHTPVYVCRRIDRPITLSGKGDDPVWNKADAVDLVDAVTAGSPAQATKVRLLHDSTMLYVLFECEDNFVWGTLRERDSHIFNEECVEVFLCPSGKIRQYYEVNVSPLNTVFDAIILNGRSHESGDRAFQTIDAYDCEGLTTKTNVDGELGVAGARGWSVEYAIPFQSLIGHDRLSPEPGDEWRMNLYRIDAPMPDRQVLDAWCAPGRPDFHLPWHFGRLVFE